MADRKISDLTALTAPASGDYLPIVDISEASAANKNKRITIEELLRGAPDGTAAAPAFAFESDGGNGLYLAGTDIVGLATNGVGRVTVSTTAVSSTLAVDHPLGAVGTPSITFTGDLNTGIYSPAADTIAFAEGGVEAMRIDSLGRLGLGTSSPAARLEVSNNLAGISEQLRLTNGNTTGTVGSSILFKGFYNTALISSDGVPGVSTGGNLRLQTYASDGSLNTGINITRTGLVGIGTTSPGALLDVSASAPELRISSSNAAQTSGSSVGKLSFYTSDSTTPGGAGVAAFIETTSSTSNGSDYQLVISKREGSGGGSCFVNLGTSSSGAISFGTNTSGAGTESARIDSSGRLLVGTSSDSGGALFQVNGNRIRIATAKTPSSASDTGTAGEICWDADYIYVCTATNTWKRTAISTWP